MAVKSLAQSSILQPSSTNSMLGDYESNYFHHLETVRLSSTAASGTFSNLAQYSDFQHLQIRIVNKTNRNASDNAAYRLTFNSDSGANYSKHGLYGAGSSPASGASTSASFIEFACPGANNSTVHGATVIDILDAFEAKNKTIKALNGYTNGYSIIQLMSGAWYSTAQLSSVTLAYTPFADPTTGFMSGSRFSLYGFKARS